MKKNSLFILLLFASVISSNSGIARPIWTWMDSKTCRSSFQESYTQASGGVKPPNSMVNDYCQCAETAYKSGDTMSTLTNMCSQMIINKYY